MSVIRLLTIAAIAGLLSSLAAPAPLAAQSASYHMRTQRDVFVRMRDGVRVAVTVYRPAAPGRFPALLGASAYRYDNDSAAKTFVWNETGPIGFYVAHGYAYVRLDVRGTGKSGGTYDFFGPKEQHDLYDVIEWIAHQPWSTGKVGGIGQSYYAMAQWFMAEQHPPHLACIAPYDGNIDVYRASEYQGGIHSSYWEAWWTATTQTINLHPADGAAPRLLTRNLATELAAHPTYDDWWKERTAFEHVRSITVPLYSIGIWGKLELHLPGNLLGYQLASGPKKLLISAARNSAEAHHDFTTPEFHERVLLPFYDWCLKGEKTAYLSRPNVEYSVRPSAALRSATAWPPREAVDLRYYLGAGPTGSVISLNDGSLDSAPAAGGKTSYTYPNPGWTNGVVGPGPGGTPDAARRVLTFTTAPLDRDVVLAGPSELTLYVASTNRDPYFFVKLSEQLPQPDDDRAKGLNPKYTIVTKGWLRGEFRDVDARYSRPLEPFYDFGALQAFVPGRIYRVRIPLIGMAYQFKAGNRIRLEVSNGDSSVTDPPQYVHQYLPSQVGTDTIYFDGAHRSQLDLTTLPS